MNVAVIGTGYVGLVSGSCLADLGHQVTCVDVDTKKIERLRAGLMPIYEPGLKELVKRNMAAGRLSFTDSYAEAVPKAEVISIAVGTPSASDGSADMQYVWAAAEAIGKHLMRDAVIADKSTVPVGTSEKVAEMIGKHFSGEFSVVSNPEFLREGRAILDFMQPSRIIVGSVSQKATDAMQRLYASINCPKLVMSPRSAELAKYASNVFLATKIGLINEIAHLAEEIGADIEEVAQGVGTDPRIGKDFLRAGLGWGGSCFPKDVRALRNLGAHYQHPMPIISAACDMNLRARTRLVEHAERALGNLKEKTMALLGLAFKNNTDDTRESAALDLVEHFHARGAIIHAYDPAAVIYDDAIKQKMKRFQDPYQTMEGADALVIATEWDEFRVLDLDRVKRLMRGTLVIDGRNLLLPEAVRRAGLTYLGVGRS